MSDLTVAIDGVTKRYQNREVVRDLSLQVPAGQSLALIGHNGAGKTSLLKMIIGLSTPSSGQISVGGTPIAQPGNPFREQLGFLPEVVSFTDTMTGLEMLVFFARLKRLSITTPIKNLLQECTALLEQVGLAEAAGRKIKTWSKGMRQRLGLAQAFLGQPKLLILDEPGAGLDPDLRRDFYAIARARQEQGATIIFSTHALHDLQADRVALLKQGVLVAAGTPEELCDRLNTRVEVSVSPDAASVLWEKCNVQYSGERLAADRLAFSCNDRFKLLQALFTSGVQLADIDLYKPDLDAVYRHYMSDDSP